MEGRVAAEQLVASRADERDLESRLAHRVRHVVRIEAVERRLIQAVQRRLEPGDELLLAQHDFLVARADGRGNAPRDGSLVVLVLLEA